MNMQDRIAVLSAERDRLRKDISSIKESVSLEKENSLFLQKQRAILLLFGKSLQESFKSQCEALLTLAVKSVYVGRNYSFCLQFKSRKDRSEIVPMLEDNGMQLVLNKDVTGGILPVLALPLRIVMLGNRMSMLWLDEPFRGALGRDDELLSRAMLMLKEVSRRCGVQVILNTHESEFVDMAERAYLLKYVGGKTVVKLVRSARKLLALKERKR